MYQSLEACGPVGNQHARQHFVVSFIRSRPYSTVSRWIRTTPLGEITLWTFLCVHFRYWRQSFWE